MKEGPKVSAILVEIQEPIGIITLNRPEKHNAFDDALIADLTGTLKELNNNDAVRIVVLSAAGKSFSAGADMNWMKRMASYSEADNYRDAMALGELMRTLHGLSKPTIARVHGAAYGGGVGLVACCDIAVAGYDAAFALSEVRIGLVPAVISPYVIAAMGERMAHRYFLTGERFNAAEAYRIGLVHELASDEEQLDDVIALIVEALLSAGPRSQAEAKALIGAVSNRPLSDQLVEETARRIARIRVSPEGQEGLGAFLEKRDPNWLPPKPE
jgi:Enoyl-CoA hydratase/carnithine racemase